MGCKQVDGMVPDGDQCSGRTRTGGYDMMEVVWWGGFIRYSDQGRPL